MEYTPKPRGYVRIDPPVATYLPLGIDSLSFDFNVSDLADVKLFGKSDGKGINLNINYSDLRARVYCTYLPVTPSMIDEALMESRSIVLRQVVNDMDLLERVYSDPSSSVYASLFEVKGAASPIQFVLTDSLYGFFRGALYFESQFNEDSLAPSLDYIRGDIVEIIQSFKWRR